MDCLLAEHGILQDSAAGRQELERRLEARWLEEAGPGSLKALRRGWYLGSEEFRQALLESMAGKLGQHHSGELRRESAEAKAEHIVAAELKRLGWKEADLAAWRKSDPFKLAIATWLRQETTLSLKAIVTRVQLGTAKGANMNLHKWMRAQAPQCPAKTHPSL